MKSTEKLLIFLAFNATDDQYNYLAFLLSRVNLMLLVLRLCML